MTAEDEVLSEMVRALQVMRRILQPLHDRLQQPEARRRADPVRLPDTVVRDQWARAGDRERAETLRDARQHEPDVDAALDGLSGPDRERVLSAEERAVREQGDTAARDTPDGLEPAAAEPATLADRPSRIEAALNPDAYRDWQQNGVVPTAEEFRQALNPDGPSGRHDSQDTGRHHIQDDSGRSDDADQLRALQVFTQAGQPGAHEATRPAADQPNGQGPQGTDPGTRRGQPGPHRGGGGKEL